MATDVRQISSAASARSRQLARRNGEMRGNGSATNAISCTSKAKAVDQDVMARCVATDLRRMSSAASPRST